MGIIPLYDSISFSYKPTVDIKQCTTLMTKEKYWQVKMTTHSPKELSLYRTLPAWD